MRKRLCTVLTATLLALPLAAHAQQPVALGVQLIDDTLGNPVYVTSPPDDERLFIVDQSGRIRIMSDGGMLDEPFLDISREVSFGGEQGLLGLAFHPDFASNGRFFVNYTNRAGDTRIVSYQVSADADVADPASATVLLAIDQPAGNHNGGWLGFGPDGYLYIATGDGGGGGDTYNNGQNFDSLLAKLLRIDVDGPAPYGIPPSNPFANGGGVPEAFALGLRNPWRVSFDGDLIYIADVGQGAWEEISVIEVDMPGTNLGWSIMEGAHCYDARTCDSTGLMPPVYEYDHGEGCSITGGYVYRGSALPALTGHYFFADYCEGFVRSFLLEDGQPTNLVDWTDTIGNLGNITSFGQDSAGELYITVAGGGIYKIVPGN